MSYESKNHAENKSPAEDGAKTIRNYASIEKGGCVPSQDPDNDDVLTHHGFADLKPTT